MGQGIEGKLVPFFEATKVSIQQEVIESGSDQIQLSSAAAVDAGILFVRPRTCQMRATCTHWSRSDPLLAAALLMAVSASF